MDRINDAEGASAEREQDLPPAVRRTPSPPHGLLKSATRKAHADLDALVMASGALSTRAAFGAHMRALSNFYVSYHREMTRVCPDWLQEWGNPSCADALRADLAAAGEPSQPAALNALNVPLHLASRCAGLGALYVVMGSALGARVLHRMSVERAIPTDAGSAYFAAMAAGPGWAPFLAFLERAPISSPQAMVEGAQMTFAAVTALCKAEVSGTAEGLR